MILIYKTQNVLKIKKVLDYLCKQIPLFDEPEDDGVGRNM
jgi:hypothetical protein